MLLHVPHRKLLDFYKLMPEEKFNSKNDQREKKEQ